MHIDGCVYLCCIKLCDLTFRFGMPANQNFVICPKSAAHTTSLSRLTFVLRGPPARGTAAHASETC